MRGFQSNTVNIGTILFFLHLLSQVSRSNLFEEGGEEQVVMSWEKNDHLNMISGLVRLKLGSRHRRRPDTTARSSLPSAVPEFKTVFERFRVSTSKPSKVL